MMFKKKGKDERERRLVRLKRLTIGLTEGANECLTEFLCTSEMLFVRAGCWIQNGAEGEFTYIEWGTKQRDYSGKVRHGG